MTVYRACSSNQQYTCNELLSVHCVTLAINMYQPLFQCIVQLKEKHTFYWACWLQQIPVILFFCLIKKVILLNRIRYVQRG